MSVDASGVVINIWSGNLFLLSDVWCKSNCDPIAGAAGSGPAKLSGHPRKILGSEHAALEKNLEKVQFFIIRAKFWELNAQLWSKICKRCKFFCNCASFWNTYLLKAFIYLHETWFTLFCRNLVLSWITRFLRKKIQLKSWPRTIFDISKLCLKFG